MRSKPFNCLPRRKHAEPRDDPAATTSSRVQPELLSQSSYVSALAQTKGPALLRTFIRSLGRRTEASLARTWLPTGAALPPPPTVAAYHLRQGHDATHLSQIRALLNSRLGRRATRMHAASWSRLLLGDEYSASPSRSQTHCLHFVIPYCSCLTCRVDDMRGDLAMDDLDQLLDDAESNILMPESPLVSPERPLHRPESNAISVPTPRARRQPLPLTTLRAHDARLRCSIAPLPTSGDFSLLGDTLDSHEFELGIVSRISTRSARVSFSSFANKCLSQLHYSGPIAKATVSALVGDRARDHFRMHKGKTERRFYVRGALHSFQIDCTCVLLYPPHQPSLQSSRRLHQVGVIFRKQVMSVFVGSLALEDSFGAFIPIDQPFFLGFGQDPQGAQSILSDGSLAPARYLGINELRSHMKLSPGEEVELLMT